MMGGIANLNLDKQLANGQQNQSQRMKNQMIDDDSSDYYSEDSADPSCSDYSSQSSQQINQRAFMNFNS